jgi:two-component system, chemotaxis family, CheB/CheR fusion protein
MKVYAEIVREQMELSGNSDHEGLLARLNAQIDRLSLLIASLLDTTRISEGKLLLSLEPTDINELIQQRVEEISSTSNHKIALELHDLPTVLADKERIGQVVTNFLTNAIKYSPKGSIIAITARSEAGNIEVSVQDQGCGIPKDDIPKVFERFFRVTANKMDTYPGMGLGLFISAQIIERHGGTISVQSQLGEGSVFSFILPIKN